MARSKNADFDKVEDPNLLPVMNIMFLLIPALLLSMEVASMAAIPVAPPSSSAIADKKEEKPKEDEKPLNLKVFITSEGFRVSASNQQEGAEAGQAADSKRPTIPLSNANASLYWDRFDYTALEAKAKEYKAAYPHESMVTLSAENDVPLQVIVSAMDALRGRACRTAYVSEEMPPDCYFIHAFLEAGTG
jgi:biopolymer transport protein ExbD